MLIIKFMFMSQNKNTGRSQYVLIDYSSFESLDECKYVGTTETNENSMQKEIRNRWKSVNGFHSMLI
jgi:hypothetical protein